MTRKVTTVLLGPFQLSLINVGKDSQLIEANSFISQIGPLPSGTAPLAEANIGPVKALSPMEAIVFCRLVKTRNALHLGDVLERFFYPASQPDKEKYPHPTAFLGTLTNSIVGEKKVISYLLALGLLRGKGKGLTLTQRAIQQELGRVIEGALYWSPDVVPSLNIRQWVEKRKVTPFKRKPSSLYDDGGFEDHERL